MMSELKPCPFCGGEATLMCSGSSRRTRRGWYPTCLTENCPGVTEEQDEQGGTHFDYFTKAEAIAAWNTRTLAPASTDAMEAARKTDAASHAHGTPASAAIIQQYGDQRADKATDEAYELGKSDGCSEAVQEIDLLTGGDGEYRYCMGGDSDRHCPDPETMKARIVERYQREAAGFRRGVEAAAPVMQSLRRAVELYTCQPCALCGGDCSSANPPVLSCPTQGALEAFRKHDQLLALLETQEKG